MYALSVCSLSLASEYSSSVLIANAKEEKGLLMCDDVSDDFQTLTTGCCWSVDGCVD